MPTISSGRNMQNEVSYQQTTIPRPSTIVSGRDSLPETTRYTQWLNTEQVHSNTPVLLETRRKYTEEAVRTIQVEGKELCPFAPFRETFSAYKTLTRGQVVVPCLIICGTVLGLALFGIGIAIALIALVTVFYFSTLLMDFFLTMRAVNRPTEEHVDD